jgi:prepilin-type N-terminal cleavage/methylation domain-containing protein
MTWRRVLRRLGGERGYSLIEMLTVMVIMGVVMSSLTTVFVTASNSETDMNNRYQAQLTARLALDKM